tara:strand:- start:292 stop:480 length:189 start_codon:yes stop_codon:yes gene_type:complete
MRIGSKVKSKKRNNYGKIVKIWWDGTVRVVWDDGTHSLCSFLEIDIVSSSRNEGTTVRLKAK